MLDESTIDRFLKQNPQINLTPRHFHERGIMSARERKERNERRAKLFVGAIIAAEILWALYCFFGR